MSQKSLASLLNLDECKKIVSKFNKETGNNFQVKTYEIEEATDVKGFLAEYFRLTIECFKQQTLEMKLDNGNGEFDENDNAAIYLRFFIKSLPLLDEQHEKVTIFQKESNLYRSLLLKLQKYSFEPWSPKVYLCYDNLIVLEDLNTAGLCSLASKEYLNQKEMLPILNALAAMHASSLLYEFDTNDNIEETFDKSLKEITVHPEIPWFSTGLKALLEIAKNLPKYQLEVSQTFINFELPIHLKNLYFMVNSSPKYRNVFCHRDTWGGNIFLDKQNQSKSAVFVDFQTCRYSPPAIDIIFTLFMNLTKEERLEKQSKYLKYYYERLLLHVKNYIGNNKSIDDVIFPEEELLESIEEFQLLGFVYRALALTILKVPREFVTDYYKNVERSEKLLLYMKESEEFRKLMEESVEDIIEAIVDISIKSDFC